jgi:hypothetical protein
VIEGITEMTVFYAKEKGVFRELIMYLMEERMKAIEQKVDVCKNILYAGCGKDEINKWNYNKLVVMDKNRAFIGKQG